MDEVQNNANFVEPLRKKERKSSIFNYIKCKS